MMRFHVAAVLLIALSLPLAAHANPITYQKERLVLYPSGDNSGVYHAGVLLNIDVRDAGSHLNPDWLQLTGYAAGTGLLEIYNTPQLLRIIPNNMMAPVDVVAINQQGDIVMIAPNLVLSSITEPIERDQKITAMLYTKAGLAEEIGLSVGDDVEYKLFTKPPVVRDEDTSTPASSHDVEAEQNSNITPKDASLVKPIAGTNLTARPQAQAEAGNQSKAKLTDSTLSKPPRRKPAANPDVETKGAAVPENQPAPNLLDTILKRHQQQ